MLLQNEAEGEGPRATLILVQYVSARAVNDSTLVPAHEYDFGLFPHCDSGTDSMRKCADSTACTDTNACAGTNVGADSNYVARKM